MRKVRRWRVIEFMGCTIPRGAERVKWRPVRESNPPGSPRQGVACPVRLRAVAVIEGTPSRDRGPLDAGLSALGLRALSSAGRNGANDIRYAEVDQIRAPICRDRSRAHLSRYIYPAETAGIRVPLSKGLPGPNVHPNTSVGLGTGYRETTLSEILGYGRLAPP